MAASVDTMHCWNERYAGGDYLYGEAPMRSCGLTLIAWEPANPRFVLPMVTAATASGLRSAVSP